MRSLYFDGEQINLVNLEKPIRLKGESLVKVLLTSICNTDIEIIKGYKGFTGVLGHEFVGVVDSDDEKLIGKRVVGDINIGCGKCRFCKEGYNNHCLDRKVLGIKDKNGSFAEYITLPNENLYVVPDSVSDMEAVFAEPMAAALQILQCHHIRPTDKVVVIGDGKLSQLITQVVSLSSCHLFVVGKHRDKLDFLKHRAKPILLDEVDSLNIEGEFDVAIDCTGNNQGLKLAEKLIKAMGTIVLKSTYNSDGLFNPTNWVVNEMKIVGTRCGPMDAALRLIERKLVRTDYLVSEVYALEDYEKAFSKKNKLKVIIDIDK